MRRDCSTTHFRNRNASLTKKWLRYYLDFCHKYHAVPTRRESLSLFLGKLQEKKQTKAQQRQASDAVSLYYELLQYPEPQGNAHTPAKVSLSEKTAKVSPLPAGTSPNQTNTSNGTDFPRKTYPESSSPSVDSVNEPTPQTGASWTAEYAGLEAEIKVRHYSPIYPQQVPGVALSG